MGTLLITILALPAPCVAQTGCIQVKIMLPWDTSVKISPKKPLLDHVSILDPKDETLPTTPISEQKGGKSEPSDMSQPVPTGS